MLRAARRTCLPPSFGGARQPPSLVIGYSTPTKKAALPPRGGRCRWHRVLLLAAESASTADLHGRGGTPARRRGTETWSRRSEGAIRGVLRDRAGGGRQSDYGLRPIAMRTLGRNLCVGGSGDGAAAKRRPISGRSWRRCTIAARSLAAYRDLVFGSCLRIFSRNHAHDGRTYAHRIAPARAVGDGVHACGHSVGVCLTQSGHAAGMVRFAAACRRRRRGTASK